MPKKANIILLFVVTALNTIANVNYIDISKITNDTKLINSFNYIKQDKHYFDHYTPFWRYDVSRQELIKELEDSYTSFSSLPNKNEELYLLLGDISHYLYNLDDSMYKHEPVKNYNLAIDANPKDYRAYWFLGNHYALSNNADKAVDNYFKAENLLPYDAPADFWNDYASITGMANMPSHCFYAMDKVKSITGTEGTFEAQLGQAIHKRMITVYKDSSYNKKEIWTVQLGKEATFVSRPLGVKLFIDSMWKIGSSDNYTKHQFYFHTKPSPLKNKYGLDINYTIEILMKTANDTDKLETFVNHFVSLSRDKTKINFSQKYDKIIAYEIRDKTRYQFGGGELGYIIGIEREAPKYPGLLLESPVTIPNNKPDQQVQVYRAEGTKERFDGKIFYLISLDACEDIREQSYTVFKNFFDTQLIIE